MTNTQPLSSALLMRKAVQLCGKLNIVAVKVEDSCRHLKFSLKANVKQCWTTNFVIVIKNQKEMR